MEWTWRRVFRAFWWFLTAGVFIALPMVIWEFHRHNYADHYVAWFVAGIFVIMALPVSFYEVAMHLENYSKPKLQRHVVRILWMVPVYGIDSWLALRFKDARIYLDTAREGYEAYVIYNFYMYLTAYLEQDHNLEVMFSAKPQVRHIWPVSLWMEPWDMGRDFLRRCKNGVVNYVVVRPVASLVAFICEMNNVYGDGNLSPKRAFIYVSLANNFSQMWAMYCLVLLYMAAQEELAPLRPMPKFLCVKAVVFFSFWQSLAIAVLVWCGLIQTREGWTTYDADDVAAGLQDFIICVEMFFAALAHANAFPVKDYVDPNLAPRPFWVNIHDMLDVRDVVGDVKGRADNVAGKAVRSALQIADTVIDSNSRLFGAAGGLMASGLKGSVRRPGGSGDEDTIHRSLLGGAAAAAASSSSSPEEGSEVSSAEITPAPAALGTAAVRERSRGGGEDAYSTTREAEQDVV